MSFRRAARVDDNQKQIVQILRKAGAAVFILSQLKNLFDLLVIHQGSYYVVEVKDGTKPKSKRKLTDGEEICKLRIESAGGTYHIIESVEDALQMISVKRNK